MQETSDLLRKIQSDPCNAFITVDSEGALRDAAAAEKVIESGSEDVLAGIPVAIKDNICVKGIPATCGSNILSGFVPPYDATVIAKLRERGAVILGKTNLDEFAMGSTTSTGSFGPTLNPWDHARTPGGSSGGSAAAVAAGLCSGALGSDTGGSIRMPASFCGITSLKPTYGSVSRYGLVAFASSLDQIGPMAPSARDVAILFDAIKGHDGKDSTSVPKEYGPTDLDGLDLKGVRIGVPAEFFGEGLDPDVERAVRYGISTMEELGARIREISLPRVRYGVAVYYIIATAEASSNLARYDGVRYGSRSRDAGGLLDLYLKTRSSGFGDEVKRRIMLGTYVLSAGYYEAYYRKASQVRALMARDFDEAFAGCDLIAGPATPVTAFGISEMAGDPLSIYLLDIYTIPANLTGIPALCVPCGFGREGLPIGMQLMAPHFREDLLLGAGMAFQDRTKFHKVKP
ncbi:MAG TPA: Asp-tRNA(Asn)/Glu-tRNA(Gln) amidotransferase subunit GatA [Deltaproteobacteria bacterium]|nr:Asp-tRNA(Asn)/Glu-tRNA(Gln) amidotransferase subunit GatA [Deltaproteobacteria bacterium]HOI06203.1 Asp-tRNA(Asn)/Glu-tRNA(Gln) amidotransferase subunit GatA [Deltaproteobacteria bacterium]